MPEPYLSIVIPAFNEREIIGASLGHLFAALKSIAKPVEIIVVDDGSADDTSARVEELAKQNKDLKLVRLSRNFGHQNAISAGLDCTTGAFVAVMDADLQDPPEVLVEMLAKAETGFDVVYGVRQFRHGSIFKRFSYWLYYRLLKAVSEQHVPLDSGDFCVMSRRVAREIASFPERGRFIRGLRAWVGFKQIGHPYDRPERAGGRPKYTLSRMVALAVSGFLSSSRLPLKLAVYLGLLLSGLGFIWAIKVAVVRIFGTSKAFPGFSALMVAVLVIGGAQLVAIGVLGHYLGRVLDQVERRPNYIIDRKVNL